MIESIIASVAGGVASNVLGGGRKQAPALPRFSRQQASFDAKVPRVTDSRTDGMETLPEESASFGTIQTLINRHEAMLSAIDADAGAAGSLSSGGIGRYNY